MAKTLWSKSRNQYETHRKKLSKEFELCNECKAKVPEGYYVTTDGGSSCRIVREDDEILNAKIIRPHGFWLCNDCYDRNKDRREEIRHIHTSYRHKIDFEFFKIYMQYIKWYVEEVRAEKVKQIKSGEK